MSPDFLFAVCVLVILAATVLTSLLFRIMNGSIIAEYRMINLIPFHAFTEEWLMGTQKQTTQNIANLFMFVPYGFILPVAFPKVRKLWETAACTGGFSFLIELIQYFTGRSADIDDWILNTLGGILGYGVFFLIRKLCRKKKFWQKLLG